MLPLASKVSKMLPPVSNLKQNIALVYINLKISKK